MLHSTTMTDIENILDQERDNIIHDLKGVKQFIALNQEIFPAEDDQFVDFRVQVVDGRVYTHTGDPSFDQDHRGYWGACVVFPDADLEELVEWMRDEILDQYAQQEAQ